MNKHHYLNPDNLKKKTNQLRWLWLTFLIIAIDLASKFFVAKNFVLYKSKYLFPFVNIFLTHNAGASFGFLNDAGGWQRWLFATIAVVISIAILISLYRMKRDDNWTACALAFILGGAIGNLYNRITLGYVIDFVDLHSGTLHFPAYFNLADVAINVGVVVWLIGMLVQPKNN